MSVGCGECEEASVGGGLGKCWGRYGKVWERSREVFCGVKGNVGRDVEKCWERCG